MYSMNIQHMFPINKQLDAFDMHKWILHLPMNEPSQVVGSQLTFFLYGESRNPQKGPGCYPFETFHPSHMIKSHLFIMMLQNPLSK